MVCERFRIWVTLPKREPNCDKHAEYSKSIFFNVSMCNTSLESKLSSALSLKLVGVVLNGLLCEMEG